MFNTMVDVENKYQVHHVSLKHFSVPSIRKKIKGRIIHHFRSVSFKSITYTFRYLRDMFNTMVGDVIMHLLTTMLDVRNENQEWLIM